METDPAKVAAGLTEAQRRALISAEADGQLGNMFIRWWQASATSLRALRRRGLVSTVWSGAVLSPTGAAVRAHLLGGEANHD